MFYSKRAEKSLEKTAEENKKAEEELKAKKKKLQSLNAEQRAKVHKKDQEGYY